MKLTDLDTLRAALERRRRRQLIEHGAFACAVLVPLIETVGGIEVLYTLRSEDLNSHKGQVAFPGGKRDAADTDLRATALRETHEEVGIEPNDIEIIGALDDVTTVLGKYVITPYVARLAPPANLSLNPAEVVDAFTVPMEKLIDPRYRKSEERVFDGTSYTISTITAGPHLIWGVTHAITLDLLERMKGL